MHTEPIVPEPDGQIEPALKKALAALRRRIEADSEISQIVAAVPSHRLFHKFLTVPFADRRKIGRVLPTELESHLPLDLEDITYDFALVGRPGKGGRVFVVGSKTGHLRSQIDLLREAGLEPTRLQSSLVALGEIVARGGGHGDRVGVLHIEDDHASLGILENGLLRLGHHFLMAANGGSAETILVRHLRQLLAREAMESDSPVDLLFLSGTADAADPAVRRIGEDLGLRVERLALPEGLGGADGPEAQTGRGALVALGCALSALESKPWAGLNLRQGAIEYRPPAGVWRGEWKGPALLGAVFAGLLTIDLGLSAVGRLREAARVREQVRTEFVQLLPGATDVPRGAEITRLQEEVRKLEIQAAFQAGGPHTIPTALDVLDEISRLLPAEGKITVHSLSIEEERGSLQGRAASYSDAEAVEKALGGSALLKNVKLPKIGTREEDVEFRLSFDLATPIRPTNGSGR